MNEIARVLAASAMVGALCSCTALPPREDPNLSQVLQIRESSEAYAKQGIQRFPDQPEKLLAVENAYLDVATKGNSWINDYQLALVRAEKPTDVTGPSTTALVQANDKLRNIVDPGAGGLGPAEVAVALQILKQIDDALAQRSTADRQAKIAEISSALDRHRWKDWKTLLPQ